jgi:hypothetical protein
VNSVGVWNSSEIVSFGGVWKFSQIVSLGACNFFKNCELGCLQFCKNCELGLLEFLRTCELGIFFLTTNYWGIGATSTHGAGIINSF